MFSGAGAAHAVNAGKVMRADYESNKKLWSRTVSEKNNWVISQDTFEARRALGGGYRAWRESILGFSEQSNRDVDTVFVLLVVLWHPESGVVRHAAATWPSLMKGRNHCFIGRDFDRNFRATVYDENNRVCWGPLQTRITVPLEIGRASCRERVLNLV